MTVVILGATGYVGGFLVNLMADKEPNTPLRLTGRNRTKLDRLAQGKNVDSVHLYEHGDKLDNILRGASACIDLTYNIQGIPSDVLNTARHHALTLVKSASAQELERVIVTGSIGVYGEPVIRHPWSTAPSPEKLHPNTIYGISKATVEKVALRQAKRAGLPVAIVRSGHVFGPGSAMASGIARRLIGCTPAMLIDRRAPTNATSVQGLAHTLSKLAVHGFGQKELTCNHTDMEAVSYDELVIQMSESIGISPVFGDAPTDDIQIGGKLRRVLQNNKKKILIMQSTIGRFDLGLSAAIVRRLKHRVGGESGTIVSAEAERSAAQLAPLYESDNVPHSATHCGHALTADRLGTYFSAVDSWLAQAGFRPG